MTSFAVDLIIKTYASLGAGSAMFHGSATESGTLADERVNDLLAYVVFHQAMHPLDTNSSVLQELSNKTRLGGIHIVRTAIFRNF